MTKKTVINEEYLKSKLKTLIEQREKIEELMNQYSQLYEKLNGAVELTQDLLSEFKEDIKNDNN